LIEEFAATAGFPVRLSVNESNLGTAKNFEKAISLCRGDVILLSDQDDVWHSDKLESVRATFLRRSLSSRWSSRTPSSSMNAQPFDDTFLTGFVSTVESKDW
jgi:glycosyltransferase involved in cell wall biosynthesis